LDTNPQMMEKGEGAERGGEGTDKMGKGGAEAGTGSAGERKRGTRIGNLEEGR